ncbi:MAG: DUF2784 family protein [Bdellovibrionales bacterium]|nr:DUF2784 family protein [Bdellovibrionales bacterium]
MAQSIALFHLLCLLFLVFGFLLTGPVTYFHLIAIPAVILHWWMNNNQCILTQLQKKYEVKDKNQEETLEGNFTRDLFLKLGIELSDQQLMVVIYLVMALSWTLSLFKIL